MVSKRATPRMAAGCDEAMAKIVASGISSTRPAPKTGVVTRPAKIVAPGAGFASVPDWQLSPGLGLNPPIPNSWRNDPPVAARELNVPFELSVP